MSQLNHFGISIIRPVPVEIWLLQELLLVQPVLSLLNCHFDPDFDFQMENGFCWLILGIIVAVVKLDGRKVEMKR